MFIFAQSYRKVQFYKVLIVTFFTLTFFFLVEAYALAGTITAIRMWQVILFIDISLVVRFDSGFRTES